jgi:iron-sulfur cluster repair protein YtfE (RIC family)
MNALTLLSNDHRRVDRLFSEHKQVTGNARRQKAIFDEIRRELDVHAQIEEKVFYPAMDGGLAAPVREVMEEARAEHDEVKALLKLLAGLAPENAGYAVEFTKLVEGVRRHVAEEEGTMFPAAREFLGLPRLEELGVEMTDLKAQLGPAIGPAVAAAVKAAQRPVRRPARRRPAKAVARRSTRGSPARRPGGRPRSSARRRG